jgi:ABC-2 type transport system ATP-binding protein
LAVFCIKQKSFREVDTVTDREIVLNVTNLSKNIGKFSIIKDVNFELHKGEILGLLGPNGSGKTTILKMLVGLLKPTNGTILIQQYNINKDFEKAISNVGAIIENPAMYDYLSGYENLVQLFKMTNQFSLERLDEIVQLLKMEDYIDDKVHTYSLGMRQRLGLAQAILHRPDILLLDEPTNGLDPEGMKSLRETLKSLAKEGVSIIISSHILSEIELICHSVLVMKDGKCVEKSLLNDWQKTSKNKQLYAFKLLKMDKTIENLLEPYSSKKIVTHSNGFSIELDVEEVAALNRLLVNAGAEVVGIELAGNRLEELFLQKLGGDL